MKTCFKIREQLLDYHFGELDGLEARRVVSHLENCSECRSVLHRMGKAFSAAVEWEPQPKPGEIDRLMERLGPYLQAEEEETKEGPGWMFGVGLALAAGLAMFMVYATWTPDRPKFEATSLAEDTTTTKGQPIEAVSRSQPTEDLRVVSSKDWNGSVRKSTARVTRVSMDSGFAVMAFDGGGEGRKLIVETPEVEVEVIGTRFYVDARPGLPTTIGVVAGKVAVRTDQGKETLAAGTERAYGKNGKRNKVQLARSNPYHSDSYLLEPPPRMIAKRPSTPPKRSSKLLPRKEPPRSYENAGRFLAPHAPDEPPKVLKEEAVEEEELAPDPSPGAARLLNEAERLVKEGQYDAAITLLEQALDTEDPELDPFRPMLRYERARILVKQGKREFARAEFGRLTQVNEKEVAHQARMSLCELELVDDPCTAAACLRSIDSRESKQLLSRWRLEELDCAHHKNSSGSQPNQ